MITKTTISNWFKNLQDEICRNIELIEKTNKFHEDLWKRDEGGGGRTRIIIGNIIEKGGVNFSEVQGTLSTKISNALSLPKSEFYATGVSIVMHPKNPMIPIIHMNVRYFETISADNKQVWWFGGGIDLTPHYINQNDAKNFHKKLKEICDRHNPNYYKKFKKHADDYFFLKHRNETRGVGGIFFDFLNEKDKSTKNELFEFVKDVGNNFFPIYNHLIKKNMSKDYSKKEKTWQKLRRGRYVEFNLIWDKGTKFGLETNGRTESILMSLPPQANWIYEFKTERGSEEEKTQLLLKKGIDWIEK